MTITETRSKVMEEGLKKLESQFTSHVAAAVQKAEITDAKIDDLGKKLDVLIERLVPNRDGILGAPPNMQAGGSGGWTREGSHNGVPGVISTALEEFADIFREPTTLPPRRQHDHFIPLKPVNEGSNRRQ